MSNSEFFKLLDNLMPWSHMAPWPTWATDATQCHRKTWRIGAACVMGSGLDGPCWYGMVNIPPPPKKGPGRVKLVTFGMWSINNRCLRQHYLPDQFWIGSLPSVEGLMTCHCPWLGCVKLGSPGATPPRHQCQGVDDTWVPRCSHDALLRPQSRSGATLYWPSAQWLGSGAPGTPNGPR